MACITYTEVARDEFNYGTGSDYKNGILGHDDVIKMVPELLRTKPLLRALVAQGFPFVSFPFQRLIRIISSKERIR